MSSETEALVNKGGEDHEAVFEEVWTAGNDSLLESSSDVKGETLTPEQQAAAVRTIDLRILPFITVLYFLSFLDRVNIANAQLGNMEESLNMTDSQYGIALAVFYVGYILCEVPSNMLLKSFGPRKWISQIMISWGILSTACAFVQDFSGLAVCRFLLGIAEAGFFPGVAYYLTFWYKPNERASRFAIFYCLAVLSGAFGGILAYGIVTGMDQASGWEGWRWMILFEGLPSIALGIVTWFYLPDNPMEASKWFTLSERLFLVDRLKDRMAAGKDDKLGVRDAAAWEKVKGVFTDPVIIMFSLLNFFMLFPLFAVSAFGSVIITDAGFSNTDGQLLSVIPYAVGCVVSISVAFHSDKTGERAGYIMSASFLGCVMFFLMALVNNPTFRVLGVVVVTTCAFSCVSPFMAWLTNCLHGNTISAAGIALVVSVGNLGGIIASVLYAPLSKPAYFSICAVATLLAFLVSMYLRMYLSKRQVEEFYSSQPAATEISMSTRRREAGYGATIAE